jgi:hypothetical protein
MAFQIVVKVRGAQKDEIYGPSMEKQEAEEQLNRIRGDLGTSERPDLPWLAVIGKDILSANIVETEY